MVEVVVKIFCPECGAWFKIDRATLPEEDLERLRALLREVKFKPSVGSPIFQDLSELIKLEEKGR